MNNITGWVEGLPVLEVLCERPNPTNPDCVPLIAWCKYCNRLHQHGGRRVDIEEFVARGAHCGRASPIKLIGYQLHRVPWERTHTQDGITAPVLDLIGWQRNGSALVICPKCCKKHRHHVARGVEYTLVEGRCYPRYFVRQEVAP